MHATDIPNFEKLTDLERLRLADELIASVRDPETLPVPVAHRLTLDSRWEKFLANPESALNEDQFRARLETLKR